MRLHLTERNSLLSVVFRWWWDGWSGRWWWQVEALSALSSYHQGSWPRVRSGWREWRPSPLFTDKSRVLMQSVSVERRTVGSESRWLMTHRLTHTHAPKHTNTGKLNSVKAVSRRNISLLTYIMCAPRFLNEPPPLFPKKQPSPILWRPLHLSGLLLQKQHLCRGSGMLF